MNSISAAGRIVADAEVKFLPNGDPLCSFRVASDVGFGDRKSTNWFNCQIWGARGEKLAPHLLKGQQVTVFGTLTMREWTSKDGVKQLSPDIRVNDIALQGGKQGDSAPSSAARQPAAGGGNQRPAPNFSDMDQDIPF